MSGKSNFSRLVFLLGFISIISEASGQCPWDRDPRFAEKLSSTCLCKTGPPERQTLSIQCQRVDFPHLIGAMQEHAQDVVISALLVHNSTSVGPTLSDFLFKNLKIISLQISHCGVREISDNAFRGLENTLQNLNLEGNELRHIPVDSLRLLRLVSLLDLTENRIHFAPDNAFVTLRLKTLKLGGNNVTLSANALRGQETSLKNLNLKNCQLKEIPAAVLNMNGVTFLDLAQNNIRILRPGIFRQMHNLTALNLEQNLIPALHPGLFEGVTDSLTSLSLLNNLLPEYPIEALLTLKQLRVLDLGFNQLRILPVQAFRGTKHLTLLAVDGNPMSTLPEAAFLHLNESLRGLSLGGRFLACNCDLHWVSEWIKKYELQVTSRERNPQFCGHPQELREKNFYELTAQDLKCPPPTTLPPRTTTTRTTTTTVRTTTTTQPRRRTTVPPPPPFPPRNVFRPKLPRSETPSVAANGRLGVQPGDQVMQIRMTVGQESRVPPPQVVTSEPQLPPVGRPRGPPHLAAARPVPQPRRPPQVPTPPTGQIISRPRDPPTRPPPPPPPASNAVLNGHLGDRPRSIPAGLPDLPAAPKIVNKSGVGTNLTPRPPQQIPRRSSEHEVDEANARRLHDEHKLTGGPMNPQSFVEVIVRDAYKEDNSITIKWDSEVSNILGFKVVYRLFGQSEFKRGPPLEKSEREFKIKNVPAHECIVVCVVSLEEINISPSTVPYEQCREIRTDGVGAAQKLDWIIIPASAAIVATVVIAVIIFIACLKSSQKTREAKILDEKQPIHTLSMNGMGTLGHHAPSAPGPPLAGLATLGLGPGAQKDWDQMSMYSQRTDRSVPRARMYHMERAGSISGAGGYIPEDARSHLSAMSQRASAISKSRSIGDLTGKGSGYLNGLGLSRQDLRQSRQSLVSHSGGFETNFGRASSRAASRASRKSRQNAAAIAANAAAAAAAAAANARRRSRSRDRLHHYSSHQRLPPPDQDSLNDEEDEEEDDDDTLGEEEDHWATSTDNNWTDYDQDIYMHRNTTKFGQRGMFSRDDVNL